MLNLCFFLVKYILKKSLFSKPLKAIQIVTKSETLKGFRSSETTRFFRKLWRISDFVTIWNTLRVFEVPETFSFTLEKPFKSFREQSIGLREKGFVWEFRK
jgi:hypothetical protein